MDDVTLNGEVRTILDFVASDDGDFDIGEFMKHWPEKVADQRVVTAMLIVRNTRELSRLTNDIECTKKAITINSVVASIALGLATLSIMMYAGLDPILSIASGFAAGGVGQLIAFLGGK